MLPCDDVVVTPEPKAGSVNWVEQHGPIGKQSHQYAGVIAGLLRAVTQTTDIPNIVYKWISSVNWQLIRRFHWTLSLNVAVLVAIFCLRSNK